MQPAVRRILFWAALSAAAVAVGAPIGIGVALLNAPTEEPSLPPLLPPLLLAPEDGATTEESPRFAWGGDAQGGTFAIELAGDASFAERVERHDGLSGNAWTREQPFLPGAAVFWRMRTHAGDGAISEWSAPFSFAPFAALPLPSEEKT